MRPGFSGSTFDMSDIEELHVLRVLLDELAARYDLVTHAQREQRVCGGCVLDLHPDQHPSVRVHRRRRKLFGIHLAQPLEAAHLDAVLREIERTAAQLLERLGLRLLLAKAESERWRADDVDELPVASPEVLV